MVVQELVDTSEMTVSEKVRALVTCDLIQLAREAGIPTDRPFRSKYTEWVETHPEAERKVDACLAVSRRGGVTNHTH